MAQRPKLYAALIALVLSGGAAFAQTTPEVFTYQGQLRDAGSLPTGVYDFEFRLYDDAIAGSPVGSPSLIFADNVAVNSGLFNVVLDFGAGTFDGATRFLEIAVRDGASAGPFTTLNPRVAITPTPYAIYALNAGNATTATLALDALTAQSVDWTDITNIPPDIADGDDTGSGAYFAGNGLTLTLNTFSVNFLPPGPLNGLVDIAARADHNHSGDDIITGTVGDAFIASTIARDVEVTAAVSAHAAITGNGAHIPPGGITDANVAAAANIAWSKINVPPDILDGDNDTTYSAGTGLNLTGTTFNVVFGGSGTATTASRSDHTHSGADITSGTVGEAFIDAAIARDTEVTAEVATHAALTGNGAHIPAAGITDANVAAAANIAWSKINVPPDILDGDNDTTYSAGTGLNLTGTTFNVVFGGSGVATTASRSDHTHSGADITSGTVGEAFIDAAIARDTEVTAEVATHAAITGNGAHIPAAGITDANVAAAANIAWSKINVPPDILDGDNDTTYSAGTGLNLTGTTFNVVFGGSGVATTASRSDHTHSGADITSGTVGEAFIDAAIARDTEVTAEVATHAALTGNGAHIPPGGITDANVAAAANIAWSKINVPPDILDGDNDTTYSAGTGLNLTGTTFNVVFGGSGVATTASRSDHTHSGADITSGTVGEAFIDAAIARDTEVTAEVATHAALTGLGAHIPATGINSALVQDNTLTDEDLAPNSVTDSELADNSVDNAAMQDNAVGSLEVINESLTNVDIADRTRSIFIPSYTFFARENGQNGTPNFAGAFGGDQRVTLQELRDAFDTTLTTQFQVPRDLAAGSTVGSLTFRVHIQHLNGGAGNRVNMGFFFERVAGPAIGTTSDPINFQYVIFAGAPAIGGDDRDPGPAIPGTNSYLAFDIPMDPTDTWASDETTALNPGDVLYLNIRRNGGAGTDSHSSSIYLIGVEVIYPADM